MKYVRFRQTRETIGLGTARGSNEEGKEMVLIGGYEFVGGVCTVTDQENPLAPSNARVVLTAHRAKLIEHHLE